jgi:predicted permease
MFWRKLRYLLPWIRRAEDRDIQDELRALQDMAGPRELGNLTLAAEDARATLGWGWLDHLKQDLAYATRSMRRGKAFTALVVASLALGIGANTAIFTFVESVLLRPLPVPAPAQLVVMKWEARGYTLATSGMSWSTGGSTHDNGITRASVFPFPALHAFEDATDVVATAFGYFTVERLSFRSDQVTDSANGHYVTGNYFQGMAIAPAAGRLIQPADDLAAPEAVVVLSHAFGQRHFGDAGAAVGRVVHINSKPFTVIGVTPPAFFGAEPGCRARSVSADACADDRRTRLAHERDLSRRSLLLGRDHGPAQARHRHHARANGAGARFRSYVDGTANTDEQKKDLPALALQAGARGLDGLQRQYARPIYVLVIMVGLILLIACANVANLLLGRAATRQREIAVRLSIGAGRWRIIRQLLTESVLLSVIGGALGVAIAWWGVGVLTSLLAGSREHFTLHARLDWTVLLVTAAISILTGVIFGLVPAVQATRLRILPALKVVPAGAPSAGPGRLRLGSALIVAQVALSLCLLVTAALFGRTLSKLNSIEVGFDRHNVLLFTVRPRTAGYTGPAVNRLYETLRERLAALPGAESVSLSSRPFPMGGGTMTRVTIEGAAGPAGQPQSAVIATVGPGFFETMHMPLAAGRGFTPQDAGTSARTVVVNRLLARRFGLENPVGRTLAVRQDRYEIVGLVDDALAFQLVEERRPMMYFSYLQAPAPASLMTYEVRVARNPLALAGPVRDLMRQIDPGLAMHDVKTQAAHIDEAIRREITLARLGAAFALLALAIACVGLYGTVTSNVARRTNEIGIRMALGAPARRIIRLVMTDVLVATTVGLVVGLALSVAVARYARTLLFAIEPTDPVAIALAVAALAAAGLVAVLIPARRATRVDPLASVRQDN